MKIKNLLLDMGGVIVDVDYKKIISEFNLLGIDAQAIYTQAKQMPFIDKFEKGEISAQQFRNEIRALTNKNLTDEQIDKVWNSMILTPRKQDLQLLGKLKLKYDKILLFSNTNEIHIEFVYKMFEKELGFDIFKLLFNKTYFSNEIHYRKPDKESFEYVLNDANVSAEQTLFIDDTIQNINGAKLAGLNTYLLDNNQTLTEIYNKQII